MHCHAETQPFPPPILLWSVVSKVCLSLCRSKTPLCAQFHFSHCQKAQMSNALSHSVMDRAVGCVCVYVCVCVCMYVCVCVCECVCMQARVLYALMSLL